MIAASSRFCRGETPRFRSSLSRRSLSIETVQDRAKLVGQREGIVLVLGIQGGSHDVAVIDR